MNPNEMKEVFDFNEKQIVADSLEYVRLTIKRMRTGQYTHNQVNIMCDQALDDLEQAIAELTEVKGDGIPF